MWVKICGNTNLEDVERAVELGADAVGFVLAESPRRVTAAQVAEITAQLPQGVERVGVFSSRSADEIANAAAEAGLTAVQLHGGFDPRLIERLTGTFANKTAGGPVRIIQTLHWTVATEAADAVGRLAEELHLLRAQGLADRVLIDSKAGSAAGGTGVRFDWEAARAVFAAAGKRINLIVAGGLRPENVGEAIARLGPWGVDVSSGVEHAPGRKDPALVARFLKNARGAETP